MLEYVNVKNVSRTNAIIEISFSKFDTLELLCELNTKTEEKTQTGSFHNKRIILFQHKMIHFSKGL